MAIETAFRSEELFTQEEFWAWLEDRPSSDIQHYELIHGRIVMTPPAGWPHGVVGSAINGLIGAHVRSRQLGIVLDASAGFDLPSGDTLEPDVSFVSAARLAAGPAPVRGRFLRIVPDLVVEILSDSMATRDRTEKRDIYAANGVEEYWLVDTDRREVIVLNREDDRMNEGTLVASGPIPSRVLLDLVIAVEDVFALPK